VLLMRNNINHEGPEVTRRKHKGKTNDPSWNLVYP